MGYTVKNLPLYRGIKGIRLISHGMWSDAELVYKGYVFNYNDIDDALWEIFLEDQNEVEAHYLDRTGADEQEKRFNHWLEIGRPAQNYLDDCIFGKCYTGYFYR